MDWRGTASDGTEVKGTLTIPEVSHEVICDKLSDFVVSTRSCYDLYASNFIYLTSAFWI